MKDLIQRKDVEALIETLKSGAEQLPTIAEQLITYKLVETSGLLFIGVCLLLIALKCWKGVRIYLQKDYTTEREDIIATAKACIGLAGTIFGTILSIMSFTALVKLIFAPQVYLLEYFRSLL